MTTKPVPPYGRRAGFVPRLQEDFGGSGAFPEVHVPQYPLSMGRETPGSDMLAITVDARGRVAFEAVVRHGESSAKIVYSSHGDLVPRTAATEDSYSDDEEDEQEATTARTRAALQVIVDACVSAVQPASARSRHRDPAFVKYRPARRSPAGAEERIVRVEHAQEDPVLPLKHKRKRMPRPAGSPPVTVLHSPPRPASREDQNEWRIPPVISSWKNPKGYSIPLDKRMASGGGGLDDVLISDGFAGLSGALYVAEQKAREAIQKRSMVLRELVMKETEQWKQELRELARKARAETAASGAAPAPPPVNAERAERDTIRDEPRCERRLEASGGKKSRGTRDMDRDVGERIALGMASTGGGSEVTYDERLFNQESGIGSGFASDDQYNVYSGRLFAWQTALSTLYRPSKLGDSDAYGGDADEQLRKIAKTERFKPDKGFSGAPEPAAGQRERPVEFDVPEEGDNDGDPFGLDQHLAQMKKGKKH